MTFLTRCTLAALIMTAVATVSVQAAEYPERTITVIVPFPAGGASDMTARLIVPKLSERVKQSVVIDNRAGANGALGAVALKQALADGYTLLVGSIGVFGINPALFKDLRYDPQKDFDLLSVAVRTPNVLVATPNFPANTVAELIEHLKKIPARSPLRRPAPARQTISPPRCSGRRPARAASTFRTVAAARRSTI